MNFKNCIITFIGGLFTIHMNMLKAEMFTSVISMESILYAEKQISQTLQSYIENETKRIKKLKR